MLGIIIVNYNNSGLTRRCIESIQRTCHIIQHTVIVDNGSSMDDIVELNLLKERYGTECIFNATNQGYSAAINKGIGFLRSRYLVGFFLVTNNDVVYLDNTIDSLVAFAVHEESVGVVGPRVIGPNGLDQVCGWSSFSKTDLFINHSILKYFFPLKVRSYGIRARDRDTPIRIGFPSGCCFVIKWDVLQCIGKLDEHVFLYFEEAILFHKMHALTQYSSFCYPVSVVVHDHQATAKKYSLFTYGHYCRSMLYYARAYLGIGLSGRLFLLFSDFITALFYYKIIGFRRLWPNLLQLGLSGK
jgi:N-acetylglucosaminyl-diphospho-decaprenol L-rhamnosyltransferase